MAAILEKCTSRKRMVKRNPFNSIVACQISQSHFVDEVAELLNRLMPVIRQELKRLIGQIKPTDIHFKVVLSSRQMQPLVAKDNAGCQHIEQTISHRLDHDCYDLLERHKKQVKVTLVADPAQYNTIMTVVFGQVYQATNKDNAILNFELLNSSHQVSAAVQLYQAQGWLALDESTLPLAAIKTCLAPLHGTVMLENCCTTVDYDLVPLVKLTTNNLAAKFNPATGLLTLRDLSQTAKSQTNNQSLFSSQIKVTSQIKALRLQINNDYFTLTGDPQAPDISELTIQPRNVIETHLLTDIKDLATTLFNQHESATQPVALNDEAVAQSGTKSIPLCLHSLWLPRLLNSAESMTLNFNQKGLISSKTEALLTITLTRQQLNVSYRDKPQRPFTVLTEPRYLQAILNTHNIPLTVLASGGAMTAHYHLGLKPRHSLPLTLSQQQILGRSVLPPQLRHKDNTLCYQHKRYNASRYFFSRTQLKIEKIGDDSYQLTHLAAGLRTFVINDPSKILTLNETTTTTVVMSNKPVVCGMYGFTFNPSPLEN